MPKKPECAMDFLSLPLVQWKEAVNKLSAEERRLIEQDAAHISQRAATLSAYLTHRTETRAALTVDSATYGHGLAVAHAQKVTTRVRKALGFSYPKFEVDF